MSVDFFLLLAVAAASALGVRAALKSKAGAPFKAAAALLYLLVGMQTAVLVTLSGDGRVFPGLQLNPAVATDWMTMFAEGVPTPEPAYCMVALLAHVLCLLPRPGEGDGLRPLPATLAFVVLFFALLDRSDAPPPRFEYAEAPDEVAYLTHARAGGGTRFVVAAGGPDAAFLDVLHVHTTEARQRDLKIYWTKDGAGVVLQTIGRRIFAIDRVSGETVGALPGAVHEWPERDRTKETLEVRKRFSRAERDVAEFVANHGGISVR